MRGSRFANATPIIDRCADCARGAAFAFTHGPAAIAVAAPSCTNLRLVNAPGFKSSKSTLSLHTAPLKANRSLPMVTASRFKIVAAWLATLIILGRAPCRLDTYHLAAAGAAASV